MKYSPFLCFCLIIVLNFLPATYSYAEINKNSVQLGRSIQQMAICGDKALVKIQKNALSSKLLNIGLNKLNITSEKLLDTNSIISCDETSGDYFVTDLLDSNNHIQKGLFAYKKIDDATPAWQYLLDKKFHPNIIKVVNAEKTVVIYVAYISDKAPEDLPNIIVFDKTTGNIVWKFTLSYQMEMPELTIIENMLYLTGGKGSIEAYNLSSFTQSWKKLNEFETRYVAPLLDKKTNTLITGVANPDDTHNYVEIIGINPTTGETKWRYIENPSVYFQIENKPSQLIYMQYSSIYNLNWLELNDKGPSIRYQWKHAGDLGVPLDIHVIGNHVIVMFYSPSSADQLAYVFDDKGSKIDQIKFEDQSFVDIMHSNISNHTIYGASNGEFGTLEFKSK